MGAVEENILVEKNFLIHNYNYNTWMYFSSPCFLSRRAVGSRSLLVNGSLETTLAKPCFSGRSKPTERSMGRRRRERARVERERGEVKR